MKIFSFFFSYYGLLLFQPVFLEEKALASINLWMNNVPSRSSIHYDPHHNLLCVISGRKQGTEILPLSCNCLSTLDTFCGFFLEPHALRDRDFPLPLPA